MKRKKYIPVIKRLSDVIAILHFVLLHARLGNYKYLNKFRLKKSF